MNRAELLAKLRTKGIPCVTIDYSGYSDSGQVESIDPKEANIPGLDDWAWQLAYDAHPGFENNEGGQGTLTWNVTTDTIELVHGDNYTSTEYTSSQF